MSRTLDAAAGDEIVDDYVQVLPARGPMVPHPCSLVDRAERDAVAAFPRGLDTGG